MPKVKLITSTAEPMELLKLAAGECYQKEATDKVIGHIVRAGHLSVLEHCTATFEVKCSLLVLLQLERHRFFSFTVQSSRGSVLDSAYQTGEFVIDNAIADMLDTYKLVAKDGVYGKDKAAYLMPKAAEYSFVITGNFRVWFEWLPKRMCKRASQEHRELAFMIKKELMKLCPEVFQYAVTDCTGCNEKNCEF